MKTVTIWTKARLKFHYELREETDKVDLYADMLAVKGWIHEYSVQETDAGETRTTTRLARTETFIPFANVEGYEIAEG